MATSTPAPMDAETREKLLRAARGELRPSAGLPIGIRYRPLAERPDPAPSPAADRLRQSVLAGPGVLAVIAEPSRRVPAARSRTRPVTDRPRSAPGTTPAPAALPTPEAMSRTGAGRSRPRASATDVGTTPPHLLHSFRAHACEECGSRYRLSDAEHGCGPLTAVLVTVTRGPSTDDSTAAVLGSYPAYACESCGDRREQDIPDHACGPLTPVTVAIRRVAEPGA